MSASRANLVHLLDATNDNQSEAFHNILVSDFLKKTYYDPNYFINTKGRNDLVLHNGNKSSSTVGVIDEAKALLKMRDDPHREAEYKSIPGTGALLFARKEPSLKFELEHLRTTNITEWLILIRCYSTGFLRKTKTSLSNSTILKGQAFISYNRFLL